MTEKGGDPRHNAAFQRGYTESSPLSPRSPSAQPRSAASEPTAGTSSTRERVRGRRRSEGAPTSSASAPFNDAFPPGPPAMVDDPDTVPVASTAAEDPASRSFLLWTIALFVIGAALCVLSFVLFQEYNYSRWSEIQSLDGGERVVTSSDGSEMRTISELEYTLFLYFLQNASWLGVIGVATIVGNLFRIAPRRASYDR